MDRLNQLRAGAGAAGGGEDATLDSTAPSEAYMSAAETCSKYFSLSDSSEGGFDISPIKDVTLASTSSCSAHEPKDTMTDDLISDLSPITKKDVMLDSFKIGKQIEAANILSGGVDIFDDNDNSYDGDELVIDDNVDIDEKMSLDKESHLEEAVSEGALVESPVDLESKDMEVMLHIDGHGVDAIDIGNGLYLYRKVGQEELAAVQIITEENQAPTFKFLKVRENVEGNLEVYEEFEVEVSKDMPVEEAKPAKKITLHVPNKDINKASSTSSSNKIVENKDITPKESTSKAKVQSEDMEPESITEVNFNGKMMKFSESRKSPIVGSFTPMTYHSTPNKEGKPLTKTMVDQQLHPNRHSDNVLHIEVHTDSQKKQAPDESKLKPENQEKKVDDFNVTKDTSVETEPKITGHLESLEEKDPKQVDSNSSTNSNVDKKSIENQNKPILGDVLKVDAAKVYTAFSTNTDTADAAVLKNEISENKGVLQASDMVANDKKLKSKESTSPAKSIDFVKIYSDKQVPKVNQSAKEESGKDSSSIEVSENQNKPILGDVPKLDAAKVDTAFSTSKDTADSAVVKISENIVVLPASDMVANDKKEQLKSKESTSPAKSIDFVKIYADKEVPKVNRSAKEESGKDSSFIKFSENQKKPILGDVPKLDAAKVDTAFSTSKDTAGSAVVKISENIVVLPVSDMVINDTKDQLKSKESSSPAKSVTDFVKICSDKEVPKVNQSAKEEPRKDSMSIEVSEKVLIKSDVADINKCDDKNAKAVSTIADQVTDNVIEKEIKKVEAISSTTDLISNNDSKEDIKQIVAAKESNNTVSSTSFNQSKKTEKELIGIPEEPTNVKVNNKIQLIEDDNIKVTDNLIPETAKQEIKEDKAQSNVIKPPQQFKEQAVLESVCKINDINKPEPGTAKVPENTLKENKSTASIISIPKVVTKTASEKEKSDNIENTNKPITIEQGISNVSKIKPESFNDLNRQEGVASQNASTNHLSQSAKPIEPAMVEMKDSLSKNYTPTVSTDKSIVLDKIEQKPTPPVNKFIQVPKGIKVIIVPKAGTPAVTINPVEKTIGQTPLTHTDLTTAVKTCCKPDKLTPVSKEIETKVKQPITKEFELKTVSKTVPLNPPRMIEPVINAGKPVPVTHQSLKNKAVIIPSNQIIVPNKIETANEDKNEKVHVKVTSEAKPINNNHTAVPFGKWTDANRQEFLNKFKEIKVSATSTTKQIKNSNDLNRIDVLKKIDSQRHNNKAQDKLNVKETMFSSKIALSQETKIPVKTEGLKMKAKLDPKNAIPESSTETVSSTVPSNPEVAIPQAKERRDVCVNDLIGRAIVDSLNRPVPMPMTRSPLDEPRHLEAQSETNEAQSSNIDLHKPNVDQNKPKPDQQKQKTDQKVIADQQLNDEENSSGSLDDIETKMNELHGIPFVERPPHELPKVYKTYSKSSKNTKQSKGAKKLLPTTSKQPMVHDNVIDLESDEEVIEHEPITGDMDQSKKSQASVNIASKETPKKPVITENDFDKFARRNSKTFENCLAVKFDSKEPTNVVQTVKEREAPQNYSLKKIGTENKTKLPPKQAASKIHGSKPLPKFGAVPENPNKNYQLKIHSAYQLALTAKQQIDRPLNIIEDKPVKVVFMDANTEFVPNQLNVQGKELSPAKKTIVESANMNPLPEIDATETTREKYDDTKIKTKHQRKQVLTPVEAPELELIQPRELNVSPKKKRKTEDNKTDKSFKNLIHKKSYLLGRTEEKPAPQDVTMTVNETFDRVERATDRTVSAIDSLVKAAELLENQSVQDVIPNTESPQKISVKRGRGRPRKYPLPEGAIDGKTASPSPPKKPRYIDAKPEKLDPISDEDSSDEEPIIRENWTMGKINENIVCPICNKLFRSENVVFKHVKHCSGVSPTRSDLDKRKTRYSKDTDDNKSESQSEDMDFDEKQKTVRTSHRKRTSHENTHKKSIAELESEKSKHTEEIKVKSKSVTDIADNETQEQVKLPVENLKREPTLQEIADEKLKSKQSDKKENAEKSDTKLVEDAINESAEKAKNKTSIQRSSNLVCEFCGKSFRQLSYLANHKLQHQREQLKKPDVKLNTKLQVFSCEVCKKEFRKLHHLVQHRILHNPDVPTRTTRKSSSEQKETKVLETLTLKQSEDTSAGFRCEPCDKSFRKLHHLVEHRETHDGINRQKTNPPTIAQPIEKPPPSPQSEICKKTFSKIHNLIEHKEQYHNNVEQIETSSEKSDDKSVQSSLSTRDIIHECSLCYMVFPNEHSLNKHFVFCQQKKKRQSKAKDKPVNAGTVEIVEESLGTEDDSTDAEDAPEIIPEDVIKDEKVETEGEINIIAEPVVENKSSEEPVIEKTPKEEKPVEVPEIPKAKEKESKDAKSAPAKRELPKSIDISDENKIILEKIKKINEKKVELPKKTAVKDKVTSTVTKRQKSIAPLPVVPEDPPAKSSDDDEVRYMLNPNFKEDDINEEKVFMKVRSNKRNSLQIERPTSRDQFLVNRRTSLQHPPKIPRLKAKAVEPKVVPAATKTITKSKTITAQAASTDSDDSDVKYSFPVTVPKETSKPQDTPKDKKILRKCMADKRKSLSGIAKRKSLGEGVAKLKVNLPIRVIKRRTLDVEHRCDCGQLFNSGALLSRHTSLAHTPPRIRRNRSPPPDPPKVASTQPSKSSIPAKTTRNSSVKSEASTSKPTTKTSAKSNAPASRKSVVPESQKNKTSGKAKRNAPHRGVPLPDKKRKLMMRSAKTPALGSD